MVRAMSTTTDTITAVQEQVLQAVKQAQEFTVDAVRTVTDTVAPLVSDLPKAPFADQLPDPAKAVESGYSFVEQLLAQAGLLDEEKRAAAGGGSDEGPDTESAIRADPRLTGEQKDALLAVYRSYVAANR